MLGTTIYSAVIIFLVIILLLVAILLVAKAKLVQSGDVTVTSPDCTNFAFATKRIATKSKMITKNIITAEYIVVPNIFCSFNYSLLKFNSQEAHKCDSHKSCYDKGDTDTA